MRITRYGNGSMVPIAEAFIRAYMDVVKKAKYIVFFCLLKKEH